MVGLGKRFFSLAFDIHEGEYARAMLMQANIFLIVLSLLIAKPVVNALFLTNVGIEKLPVVFVLVALAAMVVSSIYARELGRVPLNTIIGSTIAIAVMSLVVLGILLQLHVTGDWVYYVFYIVVAIFGVVMTSQVWILANLLFNAREASRLFGFIAAGAIGGGITGGYLTSILAPIIGSENLIFVAAALLALCLPLSSHIWRRHVAKLSLLQHRRRMTRFAEHPIRIISSSKHLLYLASIVGLGVIVAKLVDYQFSALATAAIESSDELAAFFGFWFSTFNAVSLFIQLFLTRRIVGMYGVGLSLFVLPVALFFGASLLVFFPILSVGIFLKASDVTLKQSLNKSATELLALPIPVKIKNQVKSFIDIFVDSAATGIGGLILIFMVSGLDLSVRFVSLLILPLVAVWLYFAVGVRNEYLRSFKTKISALDKRVPETEIESKTVIGGLQQILQNGSDEQITFVLKKATEESETRLFGDILQLLSHQSPGVRAEALKTLYFFRNPNVSDSVEPLIQDESPEVRVRAVEYLIEQPSNDRVALLNKYLDHDDDAVSAAALVGVARESRNNPGFARLSQLETRLKAELEQLDRLEDPEVRRQQARNVVRAIGLANLPDYYWVIEDYLSSGDAILVDEAIASAGVSMSTLFTPRIARYLTDDRHRDRAAGALAGCGPGILEVLTDLISSGDLDTEIIRQLPQVAERLAYAESVGFLFHLIDHDDISVQIEALRALNNLKIRNPHLVVDRKDVIELIVHESKLYLDTIAALFAETQQIQQIPTGPADGIVRARRSLIELLQQRLDAILERIFRLLGLRYPPDEIVSIYHGIQSDNDDLRVNSVEYLDNLLHGDLKRILIPIVETALLQTVSEETIRVLRIDVPGQRECFEMLLDGSDVEVKQAVLHLIEAMGDPDYLELVQRYSGHVDARIRDFAKRAESSLLRGVNST